MTQAVDVSLRRTCGQLRLRTTACQTDVTWYRGELPTAAEDSEVRHRCLTIPQCTDHPVLIAACCLGNPAGGTGRLESACAEKGVDAAG